jgi:voltage-gated sodium channel
MLTDLFRRTASSSWFQNAVTVVILLAGILVGVETYPALVERHAALLHLLDKVILGVFVIEITVKVGAEGARPWRYFKDPWNVFDFAIVVAAFMPVGSQYVTVLRLVRLLRVLRLVHVLPRLQILVSALLKSIPSMGYVSVLLGLVFYVYAVAGVLLFGENDPFRFRSLPVAMVTLFQVATAEDWSTTLYTQMYGCDQAGYEGREAMCTSPTPYPVLAPFYFVSFILIGTMVILNLFIGVIMNSMEEAQKENEVRTDREEASSTGLVTQKKLISEELEQLEARIGELQEALRAVTRRAMAVERSESGGTSGAG